MKTQDTTQPDQSVVTDQHDTCCHGHCACGHHGGDGEPGEKIRGCDCDHDCHCQNGGDECACSEEGDCVCADRESESDGSTASGKVVQLELALTAAREAELRSKADYQNLVRRTQEERSKLVKLAALGLVEDLLEPLDHLRLASEHLQDKGLTMVVTQLWQVLENHGLQPMDSLHKPFDSQLMEVVEKEGNGDKVKKIVKQGYTLNGEVIRHAKVVVG